MGPNGMGKSTLLSVVGGILPPRSGYVEIDGMRRRESRETELAIRKKVVYLPDRPWLPKLRTGREFLMAVGELYGVEFDRLYDHVERLLPLFDLDKQADSAIGSYSTGQQKKIGLCGALVTEAPIMILDEPFSGGLDPSALLALKEIMRRLAERDDITVLMATPVPEIVEEIAERIAILKEGQIVAYDTPDGLRKLTNTTGSLQEALERLINPQTMENLRRYMEGREE
jgi:ABC-type multidrug transport system ATPase subunit